MFFRKRLEEVKICERHLFILECKDIYTVKEMCRVLKISESGYYRWLKNRSKPTKQQLLLVEIYAILAEHEDNDNYGVRRMHTTLWQCGVQVSVCTATVEASTQAVHFGRNCGAWA